MYILFNVYINRCLLSLVIFKLYKILIAHVFVALLFEESVFDITKFVFRLPHVLNSVVSK